MARPKSLFTQTDVSRAIRAARAAGEERFAIKIDKTGEIRILVGISGETNEPGASQVEEDEEIVL